MQTSILQYFQNIATPFLDHAAEYATMLGEEGVYILIIAVFYWAVSKKKGFIMASTLLISLFLNTFLKLIFHTPRPFEAIPDLQGKRLETATGYSFPSGHTQGASSFYATLIYLFKNRILRILCVLAILFVGISRLYLGVHWPVDVLGGWIFGIGTAWYIASRINTLWENPEGLKRFLYIFMLFAAVITIVMIALEFISFKGSVKIDDFFKGSGMVLGCFCGFLLETSHMGFDPASGGRAKKALRVLLGLLGVLILQNGLKLILPDYFLSHFFRYGVMGFWITYLFPMLGIRLRLF
ncbi:MULTISPECIES: phosphatase PAP2 family protein [unclassified Oceanispirochaeta]|uniref:phosphatase PAP2 family protein n=1 Tax=unclassified Oceanispirochaeta TaxID=2635722 RepID=UPI000E09AF2E|nr:MULTISPECIES: phosphatase PAP2 family protein [unclassified Oceanispirochaeta]MBF9016937.1 phosphatase PAP2 family protein [Oceanispirochaeta sp. M2]NPD73300.1 phosphatase PAP2 family protein [Oceanispirochaeta sp. M1]RDG30963.1 phosphatase PAP2 family protein [Oceanispirochaeta sp. M1]